MQQSFWFVFAGKLGKEITWFMIVTPSFSWRISVDDTPNSRNKAAFSNSFGSEWMLPQSSKYLAGVLTGLKVERTDWNALISLGNKSLNLKGLGHPILGNFV